MNKPVRTPYIETLEKNLEDQKNLLELLHKRQALINEFISNNILSYDSLYLREKLDYNSFEIEKIEIKGKISSLKKIITEKQRYFESYAAEFDKRLQEADFHFKRVYAQCLNKSKTNKELEMELKRVGNIDEIKQNLEYFVNFYERLKKFIQD